MSVQPILASVSACGVLALGAVLIRSKTRLELSMAKHRSLGGHVRMARRIASLIPYYTYDENRLFCVDNAPAEIVRQRRTAFFQLSRLYQQRFPKTAAQTTQVADAISDVQFTRAYRVPFQFSAFVREHLPSGSFLAASSGVSLTDLDGNVFYDLTGSYGVNLFGQDFYKDCIDRGADRVRGLGPVLGGFHPVVSDNVSRLREISGLDEISFHMSGTEAVMQAVRLARYHTRRSHLVRFTGAYHGWWGDVQPGIGNPQRARDTYTLADMSEATLRVLRRRRNIACVLINPIQAMHPNAGPPADSALVDGSRRAHVDRARYAEWLKQLRAVCDERGIVLIVDDIFCGFRLAPGGTQEYFGVRADMVTYGKSLGGGLPVGVLCGRADLMKRFRADRPGDVCLARGTFSAHPYVMGAMAEFLDRFESPSIRALYDGLDDRWNARAQHLNDRLSAENLPVRVGNLSTIWSVFYTVPSRYNWMLQYYLRAEGLALSWVGTGRLIFSLNYTEADFAAVVEKFLAACRAMQNDGWWWTDAATTNRTIKRSLLREVLAQRFFGASRRGHAVEQ